MNWKKISVLVPTRNRLVYLEKMLESFDRTVTNPSQAELIFRCDHDDRETINRLCVTPHKILIDSRSEGYKSLPRFYNDMARVANGDILMCCNDDIVFETPDWPAMILEEANKYPDGIFNIGIDTGLNIDKFPFSIVSRRIIDILGFLNDERLLFSDVFLLDLARHFNRAITLLSVRIFHDWAGHVADETRHDANKHEMNIVFKDIEGNWTNEYKALHDKAVAEAIEKISRHSGIMPQIAINSLLAYQPPAEVEAETVWPPKVRCNDWYYQTGPDAIHYPETAIRRLLNLIYELALNDGEILLSSHNNGLASILWAGVFDKVVSICHEPTPSEPVRDGKYVVMRGPIGNTKFMYTVAKEFSNLRIVMLDDALYDNAISVYFQFKNLIQPPGIIIFTNSGNTIPEHEGIHRFISDLTRGELDGRRHRIIMVDPDDIDSPGYAYEIIEDPGAENDTKYKNS